jgi:AAHS family 4-hydroxybenzoate transporter-like MFS transporter
MPDPSAQTHDIASLVNEASFTAGHWRILLICVAIITVDGYCITSTGFAAPAIAREWQLTASQLGPIFSATLLGMLLGAPLFGYIGDRFGRRNAILIATAIFASFTMFSALAATPLQLIVIRIIDGIGIGGITSNIIALLSESMPKKNRTYSIMAALSGTSVGGALPGVVAILAPDDFIWQSIFLLGGGIGIALFVLSWFCLPESPVFLGAHQQFARARKSLELILGRGFMPASSQLVSGTVKPDKRPSPLALFRNGLQWVTPLVWLANACNFLVIFFLISWTPILLQQLNVSEDQASGVNAVFALAGVAGAFLAMRYVDRYGFKALFVTFFIGGICTALMGNVSSVGVLLLVAFAAGASIVSTQFSLGAMSAVVYPSAIKSMGAGWALAVGRGGSVIGPLLGAVLVGAQLEVTRLYFAAALPLFLAAVVALILAKLVSRLPAQVMGSE